MEIYRVSFIGHRVLNRIRSIEEKMKALIRELLRTKEYVEFYVGRNGDFDILAASAIKHIQNELESKNSSLILVLPYHVKDEEYFENFYDEIYMPTAHKTHFKAAISKRNEWMIDNSELLIAYVENETGGAYKALKYAEQKSIEIINIANDSE